MKFKLSFLIFITCVLLFAACKHQPVEPVAELVKRKYLSKIQGVNYDQSTFTTEFIYDDKDHLKTTTTVTSFSNYFSDNSVVNYSYNTDGSITRIERSIDDPAGRATLTDDFVYANGKVKTITHTKTVNGNVSTFAPTSNFTYTGDKLTQGNGTYAYDSNNNLIKQTTNFGTTNWTFDTKKSIYTNFPRALKNIGIQIDKPEYSSPNNVTSSARPDVSGTEDGVNCTYTYDSEGYPLTMSQLSKMRFYEPVLNKSFTYTYIEL